jgi:transposase
MAEIVDLTMEQYSAIALLADGLKQGETAERLGVTRGTINRWCNHVPAFATELQSEVARRKGRVRQQYQVAADAAQDETITQFKSDLLEFQENLRESYQMRIERGIKLIERAGARFDDLPDEAIAMKDIAALVAAGDRLVGQGFEGWAQSLGLTELMARLENGEI